MGYQKLFKSYFSFVEILCHNHTSFLMELDTR